MTIGIGIYVYPEVEVLDFAGPYEVFCTASRVARRLAPASPPPFSTWLVAEAREPVRARAGFTVVPDHAIGDHPALDVLVVPGGVHEPKPNPAGKDTPLGPQESRWNFIRPYSKGEWRLGQIVEVLDDGRPRGYGAHREVPRRLAPEFLQGPS